MASGPLISVDELSAALAAHEPVTLLDVRWRLGGPPGIDAFRTAHLPGAVFVDLDRDLAAAPGSRGRHPLPDTTAAQSAFERLGVRQGQPVVVYDDVGATVAARAWWNLRYFGHGDARVLDGGLPAWVAAGLPVEAGDVVAASGDFVAQPGGMPMLDAASASEMTRGGVLLDVRVPERYRGDVEPVDPVAGHVPGATSAPATGNLDTDGSFLPPEALASRFADLGVGAETPVGAYCGSGVNAAQTVLALDVAGLSGALYVGSWSEWVADRTRPVATGEA